MFDRETGELRITLQIDLSAALATIQRESNEKGYET